jgi:hypothetical protein
MLHKVKNEPSWQLKAFEPIDTEESPHSTVIKMSAFGFHEILRIQIKKMAAIVFGVSWTGLHFPCMGAMESCFSLCLMHAAVKRTIFWT